MLFVVGGLKCALLRKGVLCPLVAVFCHCHLCNYKNGMMCFFGVDFEGDGDGVVECGGWWSSSAWRLEREAIIQ